MLEDELEIPGGPPETILERAIDNLNHLLAIAVVKQEGKESIILRMDMANAVEQLYLRLIYDVDKNEPPGPVRNRLRVLAALISGKRADRLKLQELPIQAQANEES